MEMNTKEAIEWLKDAEEIAELKKWRVDKIIELLQRGEKFEKIVNELENCLLPEQYQIVEILVQEYFPKRVK